MTTTETVTYQDFFRDKRVTVMGLGLLGRGVGDAAYIAAAGAAEVIVTDLKSSEELSESVAQLRQFENITFVLGEHREQDFRDRDFVLVSADVHYTSPYLQVAREAEVPLYQSAALFAELAEIPIIGVTGTRGKSTVAHLIHHVLEQVTGESVILGGNVRGVSNLQLLNKVHDGALAVMELDSWQLQGWGWRQRSPDIAVFTSFMPDHLDYYARDGATEAEALTRYFTDKANIFRYQDESATLVTTPQVFERAQVFAKGLGVTLGQEVVMADASVLPDDGLLAMPGEHNKVNAALAYEALRALSLSDSEILPAFGTFPGVPGRLQYVGVLEDRMVAVYNDNNATTPQATVAAIRALAPEAPVHLIAGGSDKGLDLASLVQELRDNCASCTLLPGTGSERLQRALVQENIEFETGHSLADTVTKAREKAASGEILLFSPGFASFGDFANEYERNDAFLQLVQEPIT
jgi:UDP-N-acetylmuramoylalanine--D-glutamate ligase